jgi:homospermidine synthase
MDNSCLVTLIKTLCQVLVDKNRRKSIKLANQMFQYIHKQVGDNNFKHCLTKVIGEDKRDFVIGEIKK